MSDRIVYVIGSKEYPAELIHHLMRLKRACLNWRDAQKEHRPYFSECDAILDELKAGEATE